MGGRVAYGITNREFVGPPERVTQIALTYIMVGLIAGGVRGYTGKSIIELINRS